MRGQAPPTPGMLRGASDAAQQRLDDGLAPDTMLEAHQRIDHLTRGRRV